jgi:hypothetical protein
MCTGGAYLPLRHDRHLSQIGVLAGAPDGIEGMLSSAFGTD